MALPKHEKPWRPAWRRRLPLPGAFGREAPEVRARAERRRAAGRSWYRKLLEQVICAYCLRATAPERRTRDHVVAISLGGKSVQSNLVMACSSCNATKNHRGFWGCLQARCAPAFRNEVVRRICEQTGLSED